MFIFGKCCLSVIRNIDIHDIVLTYPMDEYMTVFFYYVFEMSTTHCVFEILIGVVHRSRSFFHFRDMNTCFIEWKSRTFL